MYSTSIPCEGHWQTQDDWSSQSKNTWANPVCLVAWSQISSVPSDGGLVPCPCPSRPDLYSMDTMEKGEKERKFCSVMPNHGGTWRQKSGSPLEDKGYFVVEADGALAWRVRLAHQVRHNRRGGVICRCGGAAVRNWIAEFSAGDGLRTRKRPCMEAPLVQGGGAAVPTAHCSAVLCTMQDCTRPYRLLYLGQY